MGDISLWGPTTADSVISISVVGGVNMGGPARVYISGSLSCRTPAGLAKGVCRFLEQQPSTSSGWFAMGQTSNPGTDDQAVYGIAAVYDSKTSSDVVYAVGDFESIDGVAMERMGYWSSSTNKWSPIGRYYYSNLILRALQLMVLTNLS